MLRYYHGFIGFRGWSLPRIWNTFAAISVRENHGQARISMVAGGILIELVYTTEKEQALTQTDNYRQTGRDKQRQSQRK